MSQKKEQIIVQSIERLIEMIDGGKIKTQPPRLEQPSDIGEFRKWAYDQLSVEDQAKMRIWELEHMPTDEVDAGMLRNLEAGFKQGNKLTAWQAIDYCNEFKIPFPDWVNKYLGVTASKIIEIGEPGKQAAQKIYKAVGIGGKELSKCHNANRDMNICKMVEQQLEIPWGGKKRSIDRALDDVAKQVNRKKRTVREIHEKNKKRKSYEIELLVDKHREHIANMAKKS